MTTIFVVPNTPTITPLVFVETVTNRITPYKVLGSHKCVVTQRFVHRSAGGERHVAREDLRGNATGLHATRLGAATVSAT